MASDAEAADWLCRDGTLVSTEGETYIWRPGATDVGWVLARWGAWFAGTDATVGPAAESWLGDIHRARAVLRTLHVVTAPGQHGDSNEIISTTTAAVDLDAMFGGKLLPDRGRSEAWLRERATRSTLDDRLDIARCLQDRVLLAAAARRPEWRQSALTSFDIEPARSGSVGSAPVRASRARCSSFYSARSTGGRAARWPSPRGSEPSRPRAAPTAAPGAARSCPRCPG